MTLKEALDELDNVRKSLEAIGYKNIVFDICLHGGPLFDPSNIKLEITTNKTTK